MTDIMAVVDLCPLFQFQYSIRRFFYANHPWNTLNMCEAKRFAIKSGNVYHDS